MIHDIVESWHINNKRPFIVCEMGPLSGAYLKLRSNLHVNQPTHAIRAAYAAAHPHNACRNAICFELCTLAVSMNRTLPFPFSLLKPQMKIFALTIETLSINIWLLFGEFLIWTLNVTRHLYTSISLATRLYTFGSYLYIIHVTTTTSVYNLYMEVT